MLERHKKSFSRITFPRHEHKKQLTHFSLFSGRRKNVREGKLSWMKIGSIHAEKKFNLSEFIDSHLSGWEEKMSEKGKEKKKWENFYDPH